jgi:hypothetical protein
VSAKDFQFLGARRRLGVHRLALHDVSALAPGIFSLPYTLPLAWQIPNENVMMARS